jgi:hypothetical protein
MFPGGFFMRKNLPGSGQTHSPPFRGEAILALRILAVFATETGAARAGKLPAPRECVCPACRLAEVDSLGRFAYNLRNVAFSMYD